MANEQNLRSFTKENAAIIGATGGAAKKGKKHLTTWIQEMMNDEEFEANVLDAKKGFIEYKGAPVKAITKVAIAKAVNGDDKAREWLAKYGYTFKQEIDITSNGETVGQPATAETVAKFAEYLKGQ